MLCSVTEFLNVDQLVSLMLVSIPSQAQVVSDLDDLALWSPW